MIRGNKMPMRGRWRPKAKMRQRLTFLIRCLLGLACAVVCVGAVLSFVLGQLREVHLAMSNARPVILEWKNDSVVIDVPIDLLIQEKLVQHDALVTAGQPIAVVNLSALKARLQAIKEDILGMQLRRECLLDKTQAPKLLRLVQTAKAELGSKLETEFDLCLSLFDEADIRLFDFKAELAELKAKHNRIQSHLIALHDPTTNPQRLEKAIKLNAAKTELSQKIKTVQSNLHKQELDDRKLRLTRVQRLTEAIARKTQIQHQLAAYKNHPQITAPMGGRLRYVKPTHQSQAAPGQKAVFKIDASDQGQLLLSGASDLPANSTITLDLSVIELGRKSVTLDTAQPKMPQDGSKIFVLNDEKVAGFFYAQGQKPAKLALTAHYPSQPRPILNLFWNSLKDL